MIGDDQDSHRTLYNFTMQGYVDLGFNEISSPTGTEDTITQVEINVYPDGQTNTQLYSEYLQTAETFGPREYNVIEDSFYVMPQNDQCYAEIKLSGWFATEQSGASTASFNTNQIDRLGAGYAMLGFNGLTPGDDNDVMLLYDVKPVPNVVQIYVYEEHDDENFLISNCGVYIFGMGFFCSL